MISRAELIRALLEFFFRCAIIVGPFATVGACFVHAHRVQEASLREAYTSLVRHSGDVWDGLGGEKQSWFMKQPWSGFEGCNVKGVDHSSRTLAVKCGENQLLISISYGCDKDAPWELSILHFAGLAYCTESPALAFIVLTTPRGESAWLFPPKTL